MHNVSLKIVVREWQVTASKIVEGVTEQYPSNAL